MFTVIVNSNHLDLSESIANKLKGKEIEFLETEEGILLKPIDVSIKKFMRYFKGKQILNRTIFCT